MKARTWEQAKQIADQLTFDLNDTNYKSKILRSRKALPKISWAFNRTLHTLKDFNEHIPWMMDVAGKTAAQLVTEYYDGKRHELVEYLDYYLVKPEVRIALKMPFNNKSTDFGGYQNLIPHFDPKSSWSEKPTGFWLAPAVYHGEGRWSSTWKTVHDDLLTYNGRIDKLNDLDVNNAFLFKIDKGVKLLEINEDYVLKNVLGKASDANLISSVEYGEAIVHNIFYWRILSQLGYDGIYYRHNSYNSLSSFGNTYRIFRTWDCDSYVLWNTDKIKLVGMVPLYEPVKRPVKEEETLAA